MKYLLAIVFLHAFFSATSFGAPRMKTAEVEGCGQFSPMKLLSEATRWDKDHDVVFRTSTIFADADIRPLLQEASKKRPSTDWLTDKIYIVDYFNLEDGYDLINEFRVNEDSNLCMIVSRLQKRLSDSPEDSARRRVIKDEQHFVAASYVTIVKSR